VAAGFSYLPLRPHPPTKWAPPASHPSNPTPASYLPPRPTRPNLALAATQPGPGLHITQGEERGRSGLGKRVTAGERGPEARCPLATGRLPQGRGGRRMNSLDKVLATHWQGVEHGFVF
jgi:hypothetical protein